MSIWQVLLLIVLIGLNGFFVGVEFAAVASRRARLDLLAPSQSRALEIVRRWLEDESARDRLIAASQLGITLVSLALGAAGENAFEDLLHPYFDTLSLPEGLAFLSAVIPFLPLVISLGVVTAFHVVLGEQVPKVAVLRSPERFALAAAPLMQVFAAVFAWFIGLLDWATRLVLRAVGLPESGSGHSGVSSLEELKQIVSGPETDGVITPPEREMLSAVLDFGALIVRQVIIPRTEIIAVEADAHVPDVVQRALQNAVTKLPVYEDNLDQVIGIIHLRDLIPYIQQDSRDQKTARELAREALFVPETISVNELLHQFRQRKQHMAVVLDEYGGTAGIVTLEDLLEEIVGVVQDPFDANPPQIQAQPDGSSLVDGMTLIEDINQHFGLHLSDRHYDTIAGFVLGRLGRIPQVGDTLEDPEHAICLRVENMDHLRIARVSLTRL